MTAILILGLDPGLGTTGWGLIAADGNRLSPRRQRPAADRPEAAPLPARLVSARGAAWALSSTLMRPAAAAVEEVFLNENPQSTLKLGQARGVVLLAAARARARGRRICAAPGQEGGGRHRRRGEGAGPRDGRSGCCPAAKIAGADAADALAVAITHAHHLATARRVA